MRIAIIGCGQLSRMLALAGIPSGVEFSFIHDDRNQNRDCVDGLGFIEFAPHKKADRWQSKLMMQQKLSSYIKH